MNDQMPSRLCQIAPTNSGVRVKGRLHDDDGNILVRFKGGAKGILHASQISVGEENALNIRIYGTLAGLEWKQEHPNQLIVKYPDRPTEIWGRGNGYLTSAAAKGSHPHPRRPPRRIPGSVHQNLPRSLPRRSGRQSPTQGP